MPDRVGRYSTLTWLAPTRRVVAWEAGDENFKAAFRPGLKIHAVNAKDLLAGTQGRTESRSHLLARRWVYT